MKAFSFISWLLALAIACASPALAQSPAGDSANPAVQQSYKITSKDTIAVSVREEADLSVSQKIDERGVIRLPVVGDVEIAGKTVREAERYLEALYKEQEILIKPHVTVSVVDVALRELSILGEIRSPGVFRFPPETTELDIVELITKVGGFTLEAKSSAVEVTRIGADGRETTTVVNVAEMMSSKGANGRSRKEFRVLPGDRITVKQKWI